MRWGVRAGLLTCAPVHHYFLLHFLNLSDVEHLAILILGELLQKINVSVFLEHCPSVSPFRVVIMSCLTWNFS